MMIFVCHHDVAAKKYKGKQNIMKSDLTTCCQQWEYKCTRYCCEKQIFVDKNRLSPTDFCFVVCLKRDKGASFSWTRESYWFTCSAWINQVIKWDELLRTFCKVWLLWSTSVCVLHRGLSCKMCQKRTKLHVGMWLIDWLGRGFLHWPWRRKGSKTLTPSRDHGAASKA